MSLEPWADRERRINAMINRGDHGSALRELNVFLALNPVADEAVSALSCRASISEDLGHYQEAYENESQAHALSRPHSYSRYTLELSLARLAQLCERAEEPSAWLIAALTTVRNSTEISGGAALKRFLEVRADTGISAAERVLCIEVAQASWKALRQAGVPDVSNLPQLAPRLIELAAQS